MFVVVVFFWGGGVGVFWGRECVCVFCLFSGFGLLLLLLLKVMVVVVLMFVFCFVCCCLCVCLLLLFFCVWYVCVREFHS